jgi:hypothetical protein
VSGSGRRRTVTLSHDEARAVQEYVDGGVYGDSPSVPVSLLSGFNSAQRKLERAFGVSRARKRAAPWIEFDGPTQ